MKYLVFVLVLAISAQPLQAGFCDMHKEKSQDTPHHMAPSDGNGHDCCDPDPSDSQEGCNGGIDCGACLVSVSVLPRLTIVSFSWASHYYPEISPGVVLPSHSSPPFRPPIA